MEYIIITKVIIYKGILNFLSFNINACGVGSSAEI